MSIIEVLLILILTLVSSLGIIGYSKKLRIEGVRSVMKSQSAIHNKTKQFSPPSEIKTKSASQSRNYVSEKLLKIIAVDGKAYWIKDNKFFTAKMIDGKINHDTTEEVNTINMSKDDLDKMLFIIDSLKDDEQ